MAGSDAMASDTHEERHSPERRLVLTINGGSSSIKFALFAAGGKLRRLFGGQIERIGEKGTKLVASANEGSTPDVQPIDASDHRQAAAKLVAYLRERLGDSAIVGVGHRVVHGGVHLLAHQLVTPELMAELRRTQPLDLAHLPREIALIEALHGAFPDVPQVACFDTAFHREMPRVASLFPIPRHYDAAGVRRLGFHGLSYTYLLGRLKELAGETAARGRVLLAHLGSGASMAAVRGGKPMDTTMAFTPTAGLVMGTRPGDLDPGLLVYMMRVQRMTPEQMDDFISRRCGLLGLSETSSDMRDLLARSATDERAAEAIDVFCYQARKHMGALTAALGGLDTLVFAGGIGEHAPEIRARICADWEFLNLHLDERANAAGAEVISTASSGVTVRVIPADEESVIAAAICEFLPSPAGQERKSSMTTSTGVQPSGSAGAAVPSVAGAPLTAEMLRRMDAYWRAANYLSVGQIYLLDNPLLREPLQAGHVKPRLLGHWGTTPGQNFVYAHLNRVINQFELNMIYISGPGHGGPALVANTYLEGTYSEVYPNITQDAAGIKHLFKQFSFPGGIPSHVAPETPGSIHEGGELGYSLSHAFGAVFDNPDLLVACVVGDGEAESGPLATAWHSNKFLNPSTDGAVLPILHLNGYKIANPTILARIPRSELAEMLRGCGWSPYFVEGDDPAKMHQCMAATLDKVIDEIRRIQLEARSGTATQRPRWPMIVLVTPKGWTGPKVVDGLKVEGSFRAHQVPLSDPRKNPEHLRQLEAWLKSYKPEELFDAEGRLRPELAELAPRGARRMGANVHANGGLLLRDLRMPDFQDYAVKVPEPGSVDAEDTRVLGTFLRDVVKMNQDQRNFRVFGPDETLSNRLGAVFETTRRQWDAQTLPEDEFLAAEGRVMEVLSEHQCQGWLEGYLLTGRHGVFNSYEAFIHIVDSMFNQHAKWLKVTLGLPWRRKIASLNYLLASHVWRQDHNGFTHQDPGFIDHAVNKKAEIVRVYLPPDANCLLSVMDHCLRSRHYVNIVVAGKHAAPQWLDMTAAERHCTAGIGIWEWASNDRGVEPDVVLACAGDVPTLEVLAATSILRERLPELKIRVVNVVDLMKLQPSSEHPHGLPDSDFDTLFTKDKPIIFAYHGYPWLIHRLTYRRTNHRNLHVRGYKEEGTITTPFDMAVLNDMDRFHLAQDVIERLPQLGSKAAYLKQELRDKLLEHRAYIRTHGEDMPEVNEWRWKSTKAE
jgi:xylulose-5-phosphate/fructose-6-phosphate phosphoketolase